MAGAVGAGLGSAVMGPIGAVAGAIGGSAADGAFQAPPIGGTEGIGPSGEMLSSNFSYNGAQIPLVDPGVLNPQELNPAASQYLRNTNLLSAMFENSAAGGAFNPDFYKGLQETQQANLTTSLGNSYAARGLSGSSAEMGGIANAINQNQMSWLNRQQSDQMTALRGLEGLNQAGFQQTMGIQGQYGNFQEADAQTILNMLGLQTQAQASNNQLEGSIIGGGLGALGSIAGLAAFA